MSLWCCNDCGKMTAGSVGAPRCGHCDSFNVSWATTNVSHNTQTQASVTYTPCPECASLRAKLAAAEDALAVLRDDVCMVANGKPLEDADEDTDKNLLTLAQRLVAAEAERDKLAVDAEAADMYHAQLNEMAVMLSEAEAERDTARAEVKRLRAAIQAVLESPHHLGGTAIEHLLRVALEER